MTVSRTRGGRSGVTRWDFFFIFGLQDHKPQTAPRQDSETACYRFWCSGQQPCSKSALGSSTLHFADRTAWTVDCQRTCRSSVFSSALAVAPLHAVKVVPFRRTGAVDPAGREIVSLSRLAQTARVWDHRSIWRQDSRKPRSRRQDLRVRYEYFYIHFNVDVTGATSRGLCRFHLLGS